MNQCVDVVIPCYRYGHYLETCVESVLSQTGPDVRVLILDDASPDHTEEVGKAIASRDRRVTFRRHEANKGHITTYNEGIDWASGELFLLLSADDYLLPGALDRVMRLMRQQANAGFAFGNALALSDDGKMERLRPFPQKAEAPASEIISGPAFIRMSGASNLVPTPTAVTRTALQKRLGGYKHELNHSGDMEMWLRFAAHADVGYLNDDQAVYRRHQANMSIEFFAESIMPDLLQRKKAIEVVLSQGGPNLQDEALRAFLRRDLGRQALKRAGMAFNSFNLQEAKAIEQFALETDPGARRSPAWMKLMLKRALGPRNWHALSTMLRPSAGGSP